MVHAIFPVVPYFFRKFHLYFRDAPFPKKRDFSKYNQNFPVFFSGNNPKFLIASLHNQNFPVFSQIYRFLTKLYQ